MEDTSDIAEKVVKFINQTNKSIFLTGKAGTGKTTLLKKIIATTHKNTVVVAPTGIAALNAGGVTIHSMFQLPFGGFVPDANFNYDPNAQVRLETVQSISKNFKMGALKQSVIRSLELLVIDEVSMLRADTLDAIEAVMKKVRRVKLPFGGVQVLFIGDLLQLPPVVKSDEWNVLRNYYEGMFFFHAHVLKEHPPLYIALKKIYRQSDEQFIHVLNNLRNNNTEPQDIALLSKYVKPSANIHEFPGYIYLTTHNHKADEINNNALQHLSTKSYKFNAEIVGDFPERIYPMEDQLELKVGTQIMFTKNDTSVAKQFYNGKMGIIKSLSKDEIIVYFPEENLSLDVVKHEWSNVKYIVNENTKEIEEDVIGTFVQYPIKMAWAITVHKSQGLTFEKAILDIGDVFQPGQAYVALSRLKSLDGLILTDTLKVSGISNAHDVMNYANTEANEKQIQKSLLDGTLHFLHQYTKSSFDLQSLNHEWSTHARSYHQHTEKSEKNKHKTWAETQSKVIQNEAEIARKFLHWLDHAFGIESPSLTQIYEKIEGAFTHFFEKLDPVYYELLTKIEELKRVKRVKEYFAELSSLEEITTKYILNMEKAKLLIKTYVEGKDINKNNLSNEFIKTYKSNHQNKIKEKIKSERATTVDIAHEDDFSYYSKKPKKKSSKTKVSTYELTLELWRQKKSMEEIASIRILTLNTIEGHFAKLIEQGEVNVSDVMSDEKMRQLELIFEDYAGESLTEMKEKAGESFSFGELKIFKAGMPIGDM